MSEHVGIRGAFHVAWRCEACGVVGDERITSPCDSDRLLYASWDAHRGKSPECDRVQDGSCISAIIRIEPTHLTAKSLTPRLSSIYHWLHEYASTNGYAPSFQEIAARFDYTSLATVHEHLTNLERKGWIKRRYNESRAIELLIAPPEKAAVATSLSGGGQ